MNWKGVEEGLLGKLVLGDPVYQLGFDQRMGWGDMGVP